jgi:hypothetical protein
MEKSQLADHEVVERANFRPLFRAQAEIAIASLRYIQEMSKKLGVPIGQITPTHIIEDLKCDQDVTDRFRAYTDGLSSKHSS